MKGWGGKGKVKGREERRKKEEENVVGDKEGRCERLVTAGDG